jgi:hypothetical protein
VPSILSRPLRPRLARSKPFPKGHGELETDQQRIRKGVITISLRLPESMLAELKLLANKKDVPYQSLLKVYLAQRIREEIAGAAK